MIPERRPPIRLDSAFLVQKGPLQWELHEAILVVGCFHMGYEPGPLKFAGTFTECYEQAPKLGFHIDGIQPL